MSVKSMYRYYGLWRVHAVAGSSNMNAQQRRTLAFFRLLVLGRCRSTSRAPFYLRHTANNSGACGSVAGCLPPFLSPTSPLPTPPPHLCVPCIALLRGAPLLPYITPLLFVSTARVARWLAWWYEPFQLSGRFSPYFSCGWLVLCVRSPGRKKKTPL